jgi:hypothetical protein
MVIVMNDSVDKKITEMNYIEAKEEIIRINKLLRSIETQSKSDSFRPNLLEELKKNFKAKAWQELLALVKNIASNDIKDEFMNFIITMYVEKGLTTEDIEMIYFLNDIFSQKQYSNINKIFKETTSRKYIKHMSTNHNSMTERFSELAKLGVVMRGDKIRINRKRSSDEWMLDPTFFEPYSVKKASYFMECFLQKTKVIDKYPFDNAELFKYMEKLAYHYRFEVNPPIPSLPPTDI